MKKQIAASFAKLVEDRDESTGDHVKRTRCIVRVIADYLKNNSAYSDILTDSYISMLEDAAPLHDLGKVSIPDSILLKPGKLTCEEFDKMKEHTVIGRDLIESTLRGVESDEYVALAECITLYHHEKWNGKGYPAGLSGNDIPLCARIMSIADVYDALRSERCYKHALSHEQACEIIRSESGQLFDPAVVTAFFVNSSKIEKLIDDAIA